ncbi:MAG TPA: hypothetical protein VLK85_03445 [Ramlibacter sp.]|nr:hypothetical protein [Ramlibacter sp.]
MDFQKYNDEESAMSQRTLLGLAVGLAFSPVALAESFEAERPDFRLNVQVGTLEPSPTDRLLGRTRSQGLKVGVVGKKGLASDLGVYGRLGASSYGVGFSWDFSPRASAMLGWDAYDIRTVNGERDVRATSLGLQWRY